jgi:hypothetical protein
MSAKSTVQNFIADKAEERCVGWRWWWWATQEKERKKDFFLSNCDEMPHAVNKIPRFFYRAGGVCMCVSHSLTFASPRREIGIKLKKIKQILIMHRTKKAPRGTQKTPDVCDHFSA